MRHATRLLAALALAASAARAQNAALPADTLPLRDLSAFRSPPSAWRVVGAVEGERGKQTLVTTPGAGVLLGSAGADLATTWEHGDLDVDLEFMLPNGGDATLLFQGKHALRLRDGGLPGVPPRLDASRAGGLWQTLRVIFRAPRFDAAGRRVAGARFSRVELNGVAVQEDVHSPLADAPRSGPLVLHVERGSVAIRRMTFKRYGGERIQVAGVRYRASQGEFGTLDLATGRLAAESRTGDADGITSARAGTGDKYALRFDGTLRVPVAGTYLFDLGFDWVDDDPQFKGTVVGGGVLTVDGREVLRHEGRLPNATGRATLTAGDHPFSLVYYKMRPWTSRNAVSLFAEGPGVERHALHLAAAPDAPGLIAVGAVGGAVVQRGFVRVGDDKRTHAASVGDPSGTHFSVDLARGALLQAWRGPFAEATEMWHDRGNDQILRPLGSVVTLSAAPTLAALADDAAAWPDSAAADFTFRGYAVDSLGRPTFEYRVAGVRVEDRARPASAGLRRELRLRAAANGAAPRLYARLAAGTTVRRLADGSYVVDDARYYVVPDGGSPTVRQTPNGQELVVPVRFDRGEATVAYTIVW